MRPHSEEWAGLWSIEVWDTDINNVREWAEVATSAWLNGEEVHLGRLFGIMVEKSSELKEDDVRRRFKYRVVFQGNQVVDQNWQAAAFQDLGSSPTNMEAAKFIDFIGSLPGYDRQQADAKRAYVQAEFTGAPTYVELPEEGWPDDWKEAWKKKGFKRPVVRLKRALYGHPDAGTMWETL